MEELDHTGSALAQFKLVFGGFEVADVVGLVVVEVDVVGGEELVSFDDESTGDVDFDCISGLETTVTVQHDSSTPTNFSPKIEVIVVVHGDTEVLLALVRVVTVSFDAFRTNPNA